MVSTVKLNNGMEMPAIGLGTFWGKDLKMVIKISIRLGYRLIDTAFYYKNEKEIGEAIKDKIADGTVKREDLFVVEKLWNTQHRPERVLPALEGCLARLQLDYVDMFLIHWPFAYQSDNEYAETGREETVSFTETWKAMEECVRSGLAKSIGVSNFNKSQLDRLLKAAKVKPVVNQVECHPYLNQKELIEFCKKHKIVVMAYSPLFAPNRNFFNSNIFQDEIITRMANKYDKCNAQIVLRYLIQLGVVPIPKSEKPLRLKQNLNVFDFEIDVDDMRIIEKLNQNKRCVNWPHVVQTSKNATNLKRHLERHHPGITNNDLVYDSDSSEESECSTQSQPQPQMPEEKKLKQLSLRKAIKRSGCAYASENPKKIRLDK
ncbi:hypothetical protein V9T40_000061 [Parthenolecanium corni]|uniref:NADP-dependent oxidoreductase domain-containing protein n=1 Tax=Parthenolecanium corni TaxID=536013 RepID=A0AAN9TG73_9HEMI